MRRIRRLRDLRKRGTEQEQDFVRYLIASQLESHPSRATDGEWKRAWREAEDFWEQTVSGFDKELGYANLRAAEDSARVQLTRVAFASLKRLGWE